MTTGERLKALRKERGYSQEDVAKMLGIGRTTYLKYESGENKPSRKLKELASLFGVTTDYLLGRDSAPAARPAASESARKKGVRIPVLGRVPAGIPIEAIEIRDDDDWEEIPEELARRGDFFALHVQGQSMEPTIEDGDIIIVQVQQDVDTGQIAVVRVDGNDVTVKEVHKTTEGITLIGHNATVYKPHFYSNEQILTLPVTIIGRVIEARRKFI